MKQMLKVLRDCAIDQPAQRNGNEGSLVKELCWAEYPCSLKLKIKEG